MPGCLYDDYCGEDFAGAFCANHSFRPIGGREADDRIERADDEGLSAGEYRVGVQGGGGGEFECGDVDSFDWSGGADDREPGDYGWGWEGFGG